MLIRTATLQDSEQIAKVHVDSWRTTYAGIVPDAYLERLSYTGREAMWSNTLANQSDQAVFVADDHEIGIVGFASGGKERTQNPLYQGELYAIYLLQEFQGKGVGRQLVDAVVRHLKDNSYNNMLVWVLEDNPARHFYEHLGAKKLSEKIEEIGGKALKECSYGWDDIRNWTFLN